MSKRRFRFKMTSHEALMAFCPKAVTSTVIPAHTEYKAVYEVIANLLECGLDVPGIELITGEPLPRTFKMEDEPEKADITGLGILKDEPLPDTLKRIASAVREHGVEAVVRAKSGRL